MGVPGYRVASQRQVPQSAADYAAGLEAQRKRRRRIVAILLGIMVILGALAWSGALDAPVAGYVGGAALVLVVIAEAVQSRALERSRFHSNGEYFEFVTAFIDRLDTLDHVVAAQELRGGFGCLNGLTDGWEQFLEAIDGVRTRYWRDLEAEDRATLDAIHAVALRAVRRW